jgi:hypothetical protein
MHCSGAKFLLAMHRQMPDRLVTANIGSRFTFGVCAPRVGRFIAPIRSDGSMSPPVNPRGRAAAGLLAFSAGRGSRGCDPRCRGSRFLMPAPARGAAPLNAHGSSRNHLQHGVGSRLLLKILSELRFGARRDLWVGRARERVSQPRAPRASKQAKIRGLNQASRTLGRSVASPLPH